VLDIFILDRKVVKQLSDLYYCGVRREVETAYVFGNIREGDLQPQSLMGLRGGFKLRASD
jgi:hypothetical protein